MLRIGLLGCGNIGHIIARHAGRFTIVAVFDQVPDRAKEIEAISGAAAYQEFDAFILADFDIVVEAASVSAVKRHAPDVLAHGKDMVIMSVGALTDPGFRNLVRAKARENGKKVYIPSGAIFGLDNLKIGRISTLRKLLLRTTKSPAALGIEADERRQIFAGKANECIKSFPKNVNVSVAMS
ncbi:aspartate dehydrogenase domain-containing protein, partial [Methanoregula sp.]|uniref:aspartate dehydrogenase domain-containing protein n=1 Tax=Methanoregula sp. TaxID=2052170 RepID=UPI000CC25472